MNFNEAIKGYQKLGYEPKNMIRDIEINFIIDWLLKTHDIYVGEIYRKTYTKPIKLFLDI